METLLEPVWLSQPSGVADVAGTVVLALAVPLVVGMYLLPTLVALKRGVPDRGSVAVINVLLGWTFLGWVIALALAFRSRGARSAATLGDLPAASSAASPSGETGTMPAPRAPETDSHSTGGPDP